MVFVLFFNNSCLIIFRTPFFPVYLITTFASFPNAIARNCPSSQIMTMSNVPKTPFILRSFGREERPGFDGCHCRTVYTFSEWVKCNNLKYIKFDY